MDFNSVFHEQFGRLQRYLYYRDVPLADIEDICQEVFVCFFQKYGDKNLDSEATSKLLYTITHNLHRNWLRSLSRHKTYELDEDQGPQAAVGELIEDDTAEEMEELRPLLLKALEELHPTLSSVIRLRSCTAILASSVCNRSAI